jgi:serine/threonine protein kinase/tetratricopeptide (TPR) repeat protein
MGLLDEQSRRWRRGEGLAVEDYLRRQPSLQDEPELLLDLIYHEVALRTRRGESPRLDEYLARFPHLAAPLRDLFEVHRLLCADHRGQDGREPPAEAPFATTVMFGPYVGLKPHAQGGLGEVCTASDTELNRTVAIKRLQEKFAANLALRQRFLLEAEITARLDHPGVVPVHRLLHDLCGRPGYVMRFIQGQTFAEAITRHHAAPTALTFRRLLHSFLQVCQTVAYAHNRGVIHRDLKPTNIMLGKFGETLVMDWGLAKVVGRPEPARSAGEEGTLIPESGSGSGETALGSAVGTPAYMSPEQAVGRWDVIDHRTDVYGLGAVLYTLLTGRPPLEKTNWPEMQQKIQRGSFPRPRQIKPATPRALEAVCLKAMALDPPDRYPSVQALAADVEHWLADEPVAAYREPPPARARRWARHHRTLVSTAAVLLVAAVIGLSVGAALLQRARSETEQQRKAAVTAQRKAEAINRFLIDDLLKQANPMNNPVGDRLTVRDLLDKAAARLDAQINLAEQPEVEAEVRGVIGRAYEYLGLAEKAEPHYRREWELRAGLLGSEHADALAARNRLVWAVIAQGRLQEAEPLAQDALDTCARTLGETHAVTGSAAGNLGKLRMLQGRFDEAVAPHRRAKQIADRTLDPDDLQTLEADNDLATALTMAGRPKEAIPLLESVVRRYRRINPRNPELATSLSNLGGTLWVLGRFKEAEPVVQEAIKLGTETAGADYHTTLASRNLLGHVLEGQERWAEAEKCYQAVLADRRRVAPGLVVQRTLAALARLYAKQQRWADAARYLGELILAQRPDGQRPAEGLTAALTAALGGTADPATAGPLLREGRDAFKVRVAGGDWLTAELASRYGDCLCRQGKYAEAESILVPAANDIAKGAGVPAWSVSAARKRVADLYDALQKPDKAAGWR